jgi:hypothetical protein
LKLRRHALIIRLQNSIARPLNFSMNIRSHLFLLALFATALASRAADVTNLWFAGMLHPPRVSLALPASFIVTSASPRGKSSQPDFNMYEGNIWAPERTARQFEHSAEHKFSNAKDPMFFVHLSSDVAQIPGKDSFTNEKELETTFTGLGMQKVKSKKLKWGDYPVLSLTGERPNGSPVYVAWIGINSPDGWTILVDYRVPKGKNHPTRDERKIWDTFLSETKMMK